MLNRNVTIIEITVASKATKAIDNLHQMQRINCSYVIHTIMYSCAIVHTTIIIFPISARSIANHTIYIGYYIKTCNIIIGISSDTPCWSSDVETLEIYIFPEKLPHLFLFCIRFVTRVQIQTINKRKSTFTI